MTGAEPVWLRKEAIIALHERTLALHGGAPGLRDEGLLDSALQRPVNRFLYDGVTDAADLAATYAVAIAKNHPFADGNKRAGFQALLLFLALNGRPLKADRAEAIGAMLAVAAGELDESALSAWIRDNSAVD